MVRRRALLGGLAAVAALAACDSGEVPQPSAPSQSSQPRVLVYSRTTGFRHESIGAGLAAIRELAGSHFAVDATEDPGMFTAGNLSRYRAVVFLNTSGKVLEPAQQSAFEAYIRGGGGFAGVHGAADTEYDWPFYGDLVGAYFASHPAVQPAVVRVEEHDHPATAGLGRTLARTDEWYNFRTNPRAKVHVLLTLDESSYTGGTMGADHPHAWYREYGRGRSFYTAGGHTVSAYAEPDFRAHLLGGIRYAAGLA